MKPDKKSIQVEWTHSDKRGKRRYKSIMALSKALNVAYITAHAYIQNGYTGDKDLSQKIHRSELRKAFARILKENGFWEGR